MTIKSWNFSHEDFIEAQKRIFVGRILCLQLSLKKHNISTLEYWRCHENSFLGNDIEPIECGDSSRDFFVAKMRTS